MGVELTRAAHAALPGSDLDKTARFAMVLLADAAKDSTGLCWQSQATLANIIGCAPNYLTVAMRDLVAAGMVSTKRRPGRAPLHLIHPAGLAARAPSASNVIRSHLRQGAFTAGDIAAVLDWLRDMGGLSDTPKITLGVSSRTPKPIIAHPQGDLAPTPKMILAEPEMNPNKTRMAAPRPGQPEGPAVAAVDRGWASPEAIAAIKAEAARSLAIGAAGDRAA